MRPAAGILLVVVLAAATPTLPPAAATAASGQVMVQRVSGSSRIDTAVAAARAAYPDGAATVVLGRADRYPDALAGAPLAAALGGPVLLTPPARLHPAVADAIRQLGATGAVLLGGLAALSPQVEQDLRAAGVTSVQRIAGSSRFDTAARIARAVLAVAPGQAAYVAEGLHPDPARGWPDAVAVSGLAAAQRRPVLLVTREAVTEPTRAAVHSLGLSQVAVVGGPAAVSDTVLAALQQAGASVGRVAGPSRYATSARLADLAAAGQADRAGLVWVATGSDWPDALTAGPAAAAAGGLLLLADGTSTDGTGPADRWLAARRGAVRHLVLVGGEQAVSDAAGASLRVDAETAAVRVGVTQVVAQLTGPGSLNATDARWHVHGTDLGHTFRHGDRLVMVFGDTFGPTFGSDWRSNTMARLVDRDPHDGLAFTDMVTGGDGRARELLASQKVPEVEVTVIPTYGVSVGGRMVLHYMSVRHWGPPGQWDVGHSGLAYSDDGGSTWVKDPHAVWPEGSSFAQVALVPSDGWVYLFGIPGGRFGGVRLARVPEAGLLQPDAYEHWDGSAWVRVAPGGEAAAAQVVAPPVGELSVRWSPHHRVWLMTYLNEQRHAIVLRSADRLVGPWSDEQVVATAEQYPTPYGPYLVAGADTGADLYYTLSRFDVYNVFLMRTRLETAA